MQARIPGRTKLMVTLFLAQVCGSTGHSMSLAVGAIMAAELAGTTTVSGLPVAVGALGAALASWPLARLMGRTGRRGGLGLAVIGAVISMLGVVVRSFPLMLAGMALSGSPTPRTCSHAMSRRTSAPGPRRGRTMGIIVWGSTLGSIIGRT